jgi:hypothetical protein
MCNERDFQFLLGLDKEALVKLVLNLKQQLGHYQVAESNKPSVSLPPVPAVGRYVVRDCLGHVRAIMPEDLVKRAQVEGMAILFSLVNEVHIEFQLGDRIQLVSVWKNGKEVK